MNPRACDHDFSVPIFGSDGHDYTNEVVDWACSKCWEFASCVQQWTSSSSTTIYVSVSGIVL